MEHSRVLVIFYSLLSLKHNFIYQSSSKGIHFGSSASKARRTNIDRRTDRRFDAHSSYYTMQLARIGYNCDFIKFTNRNAHNKLGVNHYAGNGTII